MTLSLLFLICKLVMMKHATSQLIPRGNESSHESAELTARPAASATQVFTAVVSL